MITARRRVLTASLGLTLLATACSETTDAADVGTPSETTTPSDAVPTANTTSEDLGEADALTQWAIDHVGGTHAKVSGDAYRIGLINSDDFFPSVTAAADAAASFITNELGGVAGGQPLEIVHCSVAVADDADACAAQFANDEDIDLVVMGLVLAGNGSVYLGLNGSDAVIISLPLDTADYTTGVGKAYQGGGLGLGMGSGLFAAGLAPETAALIVTDDVAGRGGAAVFSPIITAAGTDLKTVFVPPTATSPEVASALQAASADTADLVVIGLFEQGCIAAYDAMQTLDIDPTVVTTSACWGDAMGEYLANAGSTDAAPNGWYFSSNGWNPFTPNFDSGLDTFEAKLAAYDGGDPLGGGVPAVYSAVMAAAAVLNQVGAGADYDAINAAVEAYTGPAMMNAGALECGISPIFRSICSPRVSISQYLDGAWIPVAEGDDSLDISGILS